MTTAAWVASGGVLPTPTELAGASTTSGPSLCQALAQLPDSPSEVASHWPTLTVAPTSVQDLAVSNELDVLEGALYLAARSAPAPLRSAFFAANTAANAEHQAVILLDPGFNSSKTKAAVAGYLSDVHRRARIGSMALSTTVSATRHQCRTYVGTYAAQQFALGAANYATSLSASGRPTRTAIRTGAARNGHAVAVLAVTPASGPVTRVEYGVAIIFRTDKVCVAFAPGTIPSVVTC